MPRRHKILFAIALVVLVVGVSPRVSDARAGLYSRRGQFDLGVGAGLMVRSPVRFDLQFLGEYFYTNNFALGFALDILLRSPHTFLLKPFARYHFDIHRYPKFVPYVGGGLGGGIDTNSNGVVDIMVPNFGFKYAITNQIHVGSDFGLHILTDFDNSRIDFHILFATLAFRF